MVTSEISESSPVATKNPFLTGVNKSPPSYAAIVKNKPRLDMSTAPFPVLSDPRIKSHDPRVTAQAIPSSSNSSLHLKGIPDELNNEQFLTNHFNRFGSVVSVLCNTNKKFAHVHFQSRVR